MDQPAEITSIRAYPWVSNELDVTVIAIIPIERMIVNHSPPHFSHIFLSLCNFMKGLSKRKLDAILACLCNK